jgi:hypothetical protein
MDFREMVASTTPHYFVFTVDGHSSDVMFKVWHNQMRLEYTDVSRLPTSTSVCIKLVFHPDEIEVDNFYYLMLFDKKYMCPHLSHSEFFKIADVVSRMYGTTNLVLQDGSYVTINGFEIPKNLIAMTKGGLTFYNRHGFVSDNDGVEEKLRGLPSQLVEDASDFDVPKGSTFREASEFLIHRAKAFRGTEEESLRIRVRLARFNLLIQDETGDLDMYHKVSSPYEYRIEPLNETTFHVIATSVGGQRKRTVKTKNKKRKRKRKSVRN